MGWRRMVLKDLELLFLSCFLFSDGKSQRHMSQERWIQPWVQVARNWNEAIIQTSNSHFASKHPLNLPLVCLGKVEGGFGRIHCQKSTSPQLFPTLALKLQWKLSCHLPSSKMKKVPLLRFAGWVAYANGGTSTTWCRGGATEPRTRRGKRTVEARHLFNNIWLIFFLVSFWTGRNGGKKLEVEIFRWFPGLKAARKDLQGLFDEVNHQLQHECGRIERLQGAVTQCAKQAKELESLQNMLEESHVMLAQLRETLDKERAERVRVAGLLEHEQQRTQLLLDVLKHFKEKLQGLTPQVLLGRLDSKGNPFDKVPATIPPGAFSAGDWLTPSPKPYVSGVSGWPGVELPPQAPMVTPPSTM